MNWFQRLWRRRQQEEQLDKELRFHLDEHTDDLIAAGLDPAAAHRQARLALGGAEQVKEECRDARGTRWLEDLWQDLRFGARMLLKQPGFTLIAVVTLALGIGANTAIFSVVNAVLLRPLPYLEAERFVALESFDRNKGPEQTAGLAPGDFWELQQTNQSFAALVGMIGSGFSFFDKDDPESVPAVLVTASLFQALNVRPLQGRLLADSDACERCPPVVVLSYRLWQRRFGGDPQIIGQTLPGSGAQVIGVLPPDFKYPAHAEVWQPLPQRLQAQDRASRYFQVYGLLKAGVTLEQARAEMQSVAARLAQSFPKESKNLAFLLTPFRERLAREVRTSLLVLLGAAGLVLLLACANIANLLLARAVARRRELAIRAALGATRGRLVRQWLSESLLLAGLSAALGWLFSLWARAALLKLLPAAYAHLQLQDHLQTDARLLAFTIGVTLLTGLFFGLLPAWQAARPAFGADGLRSSVGQPTLRLRNALVVAEVALAFVLLSGAGLLINSFLRLQRVELGFDPQHVFGVRLNVPTSKPLAERLQLTRQLQEAVANVPEVEAAAVTTGQVFPFLSFQLNRADNPLPANEAVIYDAISPNYFTALRGALLKGRYFNEQDSAATEPVALINESLARRLFAGEEPLEQRVTLNYLGQPQQRRIVGVVRDMNQGELSRVQPQLYVPYAQQPWFSAALVVRAKTAPAAARRSVQAALWARAAKQPVSRAETAEELLAVNLAEPRLYTALLSLFGALALALAALGLFGQISYSVAQRTPEFGLRLALGAQPRNLLRQVLGQGMWLTLLGLLLGLAAALALTKTLRKLLYGVSATDPLTFAGIVVLLMLAALLACWLPARRAMKVDPLSALRIE